MKKKLLVLGPDSPHTEKFIQMIYKDIDCSLITSKTSYRGNYKCPSLTIKHKSISGVYSIIKSLWSNSSSDFKHDYIHVHFINFTAFIVTLFARKPVIVTAWGSDILLVPHKNIIYRMIVKYVISKALIVTSNSAEVMQYAIRYLEPVVKVEKIHFGISEFCTKTPWADKENIIYSPRNHADLYNISEVIDAFKRFHVSNKKWRLVISGAEHPINTPKLKKQSKGLPVTFTGWLSQKENAILFSKSKVVVSIPSSDALSVSLMEAVYSNCICMVSDLPANREVIMHNVNGVVSKNLHDCLDIDPSLMEKVNKQVSQKWTFEYNKELFLNIYNRL